MTTHSTIEIQDEDSGSYLLHAFSDGHAVNFVHAMLSLPGWIARQKHGWVVKSFKRNENRREAFFETLYLQDLWTANWAGDVTAALVGIKPLWWIPWNYKNSPPYYGEKPDFKVLVSDEWKIVGNIPDGKPISYNFSDLTLDERISLLNNKIPNLGNARILKDNDSLTIPAYILWATELWDMCSET